MTYVLWILGVLVVLYLLKNFMIAVICEKKRNKAIIVRAGAPENNKADAANEIKRMFSNAFNGYLMYELARLGKVPSNKIRVFVLKHVYKMDIGRDAIIHQNFRIRHPWNIHIGSGTVIGDDAYLDGRKGIFIGENVNLSTGVWIWTQQHDLDDPMFNCNDKGGAIYIGDRAWVSSRTTMLPRVVIAKGVVIAAGAVVTKDCDEEYSVYGGIPAKKIKIRNRNLKYEMHFKDNIWFY